MKNKLFAMIMIISSFIICFSVAEAIVRLFYSSLSNYNTEMWRYAAELKQPLSNVKLPFHHFPNKEGFYYGTTIKTNSHGFRDYDYDIAKTKGKKRIIVLGDSFTLGWGVPHSELFSKQLEKILNKNHHEYEVINLGVGNYNSIMEVELFKLKGLQFDPDMVILAYYINDVESTPKTKNRFMFNIIKRSWLLAVLFDRYVKTKTRFIKGFNWKDYYGELYMKNTADLVKNRNALRELVDSCKTNGINLLFVNIPELRVLNDYPFQFATEYIRALAEDSKVAFLDLLPEFAVHQPESLWVSSEDPHANSKANSIIASAIYKKLISEGLLSNQE